MPVQGLPKSTQVFCRGERPSARGISIASSPADSRLGQSQEDRNAKQGCWQRDLATREDIFQGVTIAPENFSRYFAWLPTHLREHRVAWARANALQACIVADECKMSFKERKKGPSSPTLSKAHTFSVRDTPQAEQPQALNRNSLTQYSATEPTLPPERLQAERGEGPIIDALAANVVSEAVNRSSEQPHLHCALRFWQLSRLLGPENRSACLGRRQHPQQCTRWSGIRAAICIWRGGGGCPEPPGAVEDGCCSGQGCWPVPPGFSGMAACPGKARGGWLPLPALLLQNHGG